MKLKYRGKEYICNGLTVNTDLGTIEVLGKRKTVLQTLKFNPETHEMDYSDFKGSSSNGIVSLKQKPKK